MASEMIRFEAWTVRKWVFHDKDGTDPSGYFVWVLTDVSERRARAMFQKLRDEGSYAELTRRTIVEEVMENTHDPMPEAM